MIPLSFEFIKEKIEKEKYILLSSTYTNSREKLKLKFSIYTFIRPDYSYFKNGNLKRFHKFGFRRSKILKKMVSVKKIYQNLF